MMANASIDPLFLACLTKANADAPESGDLCLRCHSPRGWLNGRSSPTDGTRLHDQDKVGVSCEFCHRLVDGRQNPASTDPAIDGPILAALGADKPTWLGSGMYVVDPNTDSAASRA